MLELIWTGHLNHFKQLIGHSNHYLITILIGIEGVRTGEVTKGDTFHVTWNPISIEDTTRNSRRFARNSALSWTMDALDAYMGFLKKQPFNFPEEFYDSIKNDRFLFSTLNKVIDFTNYPIDLPLSLVHLGIQWRNNLVHYHADNELEQKYATFIRNVDMNSIQERFRGLDPILMFENFKDHNSPTFKEVAAIIQSTHYLVLELDKILKEFINVETFVDYIIRENDIEIDNIVFSNPEKKLRKFKRFLITKGFGEVNNSCSNTRITDEKLMDIIEKEYISRKKIRVDNKK